MYTNALKLFGRPVVGSLALALGALGFTAVAQADSYQLGNKTYQVVGEIKADFDGKRSQWVTFDQHPLTRLGGSAYWELEEFEMPSQEKIAEQMQQLLDGDDMSEQQKQQMAAAMELMEQLGPLFESMQNMGLPMDDMLDNVFDGQNLAIDITAYDVQSDDPLAEGLLKIRANLPSDTELQAQNIDAFEVDISYIVKGGDTMFLPKVAYWSDEDSASEPAQVKFKKIDLNPDGSGEVQGYFKANLCRWEKENMMKGIDSNDCKEIEGGFETQVVQFKDSE